jgi:hypothetical protein
LTFKEGGEYTGEFKDGLSHGKGTFVFADGVVYDGQFEADKFHGMGVMYEPDGKVIYSGRWINGDPADNKSAIKDKFKHTEP